MSFAKHIKVSGILNRQALRVPFATPVQFFLNRSNVINNRPVFRTCATENTSSNGDNNQAAQDGAAAASEDPKDQQIKQLQLEIQQLKQKYKEAHDEKVYVLADMENTRRIARADVDKIKKYAAQPIAKDLLLAADNLQIAIDNIPQEKKAQDKVFSNLAEGIAATLKIFMKVLNEHGVVQFGTVGDKFDPSKYEAVSMQPAKEHEPNTVTAVYKSGFMFKDRVLRPSQVVVSVKDEVVQQAKEAAEHTKDSSRSI